jgi:hypothetical protein
MTPQFDRERLLASPLLAALSEPLQQCPRERFPSLAELNAITTPAMLSGGGAPIRFVQPEAGEPASQYETRIHRDGTIPTRAHDWHDLFNALTWLRFPRSKAALNRRHVEELRTRSPVSKQVPRGRVRDGITLFDEGGVIVACADARLADLLRTFRWKELFWACREQVRDNMRFYVFGHSIHEKALQPYVGLTAKAVLVEVHAQLLDAPRDPLLRVLDQGVADWFLQAANLQSTFDLMPLPIMGIPGWHAGNERDSFYDDTSVFRPGRRRAAPNDLRPDALHRVAS